MNYIIIFNFVVTASIVCYYVYKKFLLRFYIEYNNTFFMETRLDWQLCYKTEIGEYSYSSKCLINISLVSKERRKYLEDNDFELLRAANKTKK